MKMAQRTSRDEESYELRDRAAFRDPNDFAYSSSEDEGARAGLLTQEQTQAQFAGPLTTAVVRLFPFFRKKRSSRQRAIKSARQRLYLRPSVLRRTLLGLFAALTTIVLLQTILFPSYSRPPAHYADLRKRAESSQVAGRANPDKQKVFIAASIFDKSGELGHGPWSESVLGLIDLLGPENVYLSVYENDAGETAKAALRGFELKVSCENTITFEDHLSLNEVPHITLPDGSDRVKRIAYLSEVRNRALKPLQASQTRFDKLLYLNDVIFDPVEAAQLLFSTNIDTNGRADYRAACAVDFINPFKYYDTFATRDFEGYGIGLPFYPWFTSTGSGVSKKDVFANSDAVRVRSCWGGMVAFDARFFQLPSRFVNVPPTAGNAGPSKLTVPYLFRSEDDLYWDASECCLIHADIQDPDSAQSGIYMNPYIRVAYDKGTLDWLGFTRRFERLYTPVHYILSKVIGMPWYNSRRNEKAWDEVQEEVWVPDSQSPNDGSFQMMKRTANHAGFCGRKALQVLKTDITSEGKNWEFLPIPH